MKFAAAVRLAALEEAAGICEGYAGSIGQQQRHALTEVAANILATGARDCARRIREAAKETR